MVLKKLFFVLFFHFYYVNAWWKPFEGPGGPELDGLSAGVDRFGNKVYIGRSYVEDDFAPGKLIINETSQYKVGLYVENSANEHYFNTNVEYFAKEPTRDYHWVKSSNGKKVPAEVSYRGSQSTFRVGRIILRGIVEVGKIADADKVMKYGKGRKAPRYETLVSEVAEVETSTETNNNCTCL